ncbi:MAG TPA: DedA family protein [Candidatus Dormibacteraeota bacterium]|nr:DedA family protein [Candidatus Dormibacteraeota bacterium]
MQGDLPEEFSDLASTVNRLLRRFGVGASLFLLYVEESGVPLPVPGDVYVIYLGQAAAGPASLIASWLAIIAVVVAGSSNLYLLSRRWGGRLIRGRLGTILHLDPEGITRAERWFGRWGALAIIFGRHVPGFRVPITVLAGTMKVRYPVFAASVAVSTAVWSAIWLLLGDRVAPVLVRFLMGNRWTILLVAGALAVAAAYLILRSMQPRQPDPPPHAGG